MRNAPSSSGAEDLRLWVNDCIRCISLAQPLCLEQRTVLAFVLSRQRTGAGSAGKLAA